MSAPTSGEIPIRSIRELVRELLRMRDPATYGAVLARYELSGRDLESYLRWNTRHYTRTCVVRNEHFELLVVCYEPGQRTSIHDYDSELALMHPVIGEVIEERFVVDPKDGLRLEQETRLRPGTLGNIDRERSIHRFTNPGPERAVTLNLYAPPMSKWRVYDEGTGFSRIRPAGHAA